MNETFRTCLLSVLIAALAIGWQASAPDKLVYPINMTLADARLFVSDGYSGVHVYDVADPAAPEKALTIRLAGNRGTAVKGDIVYANDYHRLLVIRVTGDTYEVVKEIKTTYAWDDGFGTRGYKGGLVRSDNGFGCGCPFAASDDAESAPSSSATGTGSSYATFAVIDDYLYYLDYTSIVTMDISEPGDPKEVSRTRIGWAVETIFPSDDLLFVGGTRGMYVFDLTDRAAPKEVGRVEHFRACDPVVVSGPVAYVTLRGGNSCGQSRDVLLCVDVENPANPKVIAEEELETPYGLTVRGPYLYVSTGRNGYKLLDVARPNDPSVVTGWAEWPTKDFIWSGDVLYVLGFDDLRIFDVSTPSEPAVLSVIEPEAP